MIKPYDILVNGRFGTQAVKGSVNDCLMALCIGNAVGRAVQVLGGRSSIGRDAAVVWIDGKKAGTLPEKVEGRENGPATTMVEFDSGVYDVKDENKKFVGFNIPEYSFPLELDIPD